MSRQVQRDIPILTAKAVTGIGNNILVTDFRNITLSVATASSGSLTMKVQGAVGTTCPDFSAAQSASNMWDYIQVIDLQNGAAVPGDTGFVVTGTDDFRLFAVNTDNIDWLNCRVTARAAGNVTVTATVTDNL